MKENEPQIHLRCKADKNVFPAVYERVQDAKGARTNINRTYGYKEGDLDIVLVKVEVLEVLG
jgi:hypothetical protein